LDIQSLWAFDAKPEISTPWATSAAAQPYTTLQRKRDHKLDFTINLHTNFAHGHFSNSHKIYLFLRNSLSQEGMRLEN
jgi:hypothetical protein